MRFNNSNVKEYAFKFGSTRLTQEQIHEFIDDFTTRYKTFISVGMDLTNVYERELTAFENGTSFFEIGKTYSCIEEGHPDITIRGQREESWLVYELDGDLDEAEIFHDEDGEYIFVGNTKYLSY